MKKGTRFWPMRLASIVKLDEVTYRGMYTYANRAARADERLDCVDPCKS
jgi:hypothetical protein